MDRLLADRAPDDTRARGQRDALTDQDLGVPAADGREPQVTIVVDVRDDQADLVDVAHHEQAFGVMLGAMLRCDERERGAHHICAHRRELAGSA